MARVHNKLTSMAVKKAIPRKSAYRMSDGGNLYLNVRTSGSKSWEFRYTSQNTGKPTILGLGPYPDVFSSLNIRKIVRVLPS